MSRHLLLAVATLAFPITASAQFSYEPPGTLMSPNGSAPTSRGYTDDRVFAPEMRFPMESAPAFLNSQIYAPGGYMGPSGGQCDSRNYNYPWFDNYCEARRWSMPLCPSGTGHQGQDIRPATCEDDVHWIVAAEDGTITNIGSYSVYVTTADGTRYDYLHMGSVAVSVGQSVSQGQRLGRASNEFGGTPTTIHLHFNIRQNVSPHGSVYVPTYTSLIDSYEELSGPPAYRAQWVRQSFPLASTRFDVTAGEEIAGFIEFTNQGAETWRPGQVFLGTTEPRDGASPLQASDWVSSSRAATVESETAPGEVGVFRFSVRAPDAPGDYPQFFNLVREGEAWFSDQGGPVDDLIQVRVESVESGTSCEDSPWRCEGTSRVRCEGGVLEREPCASTCMDGACVDRVDNDGDGSFVPEDCDDNDPNVQPGRPEICEDGIDQDCRLGDALCAVSPDAGTPDGGADAGADAGRDPGATAGCGCRVAPNNDLPGIPAVVALGLVAWRLRRRRRS